MAKIQLLCALIAALLVNLICISEQAIATESELSHLGKDIDEADLKWAKALGETHREEFLSRMSSRAKEYFGENEGMDMLKPRPALQIFVSSSMPKSLLRDYAKEASIYGGVLVFRGLPRGSMIKLTELVRDISDEDYPAAMQIDDESFTMYGVDAVPAIILSQNSGFGQIKKQIPKHDKIYGNVPIRYALESFAKSGKLADKASEILEKEASQ
jgi:type-F conjugative transfer system pilin assembly protein TrbC